MPDTFLLIDGHSLAFRGFFGMPDTLRDPKGEPVHAVYGFFAVLFNLMTTLKPKYVAVAWDVGRPWREEIYPDYKLGRQEIDPAVDAQVQRIMPVLTAMKIAQYYSEGYEADDVMATLARQTAQLDDLYTVIFSGDRDMFGAISPRTTILYPTRSTANADAYDEQKLHDRWGIRPDQVADFKAMVGDATDHIPGVKGIGEKGATKLLNEFDTLDNIYANIDTVRPDRARNALIAGREDAYLSQRLATLVRDVPDITFEPLRCALQYTNSEVDPLWDDLGFLHLRNKMPALDRG